MAILPLSSVLLKLSSNSPQMTRGANLLGLQHSGHHVAAAVQQRCPDVWSALGWQPASRLAMVGRTQCPTGRCDHGLVSRASQHTSSILSTGMHEAMTTQPPSHPAAAMHLGGHCLRATTHLQSSERCGVGVPWVSLVGAKLPECTWGRSTGLPCCRCEAEAIAPGRPACCGVPIAIPVVRPPMIILSRHIAMAPPPPPDTWSSC
jgi:hypothetical protein